MMPQSAPLPDPARPAAGIAVFLEWDTGVPERQRIVVDAALEAWNQVPWPQGLLAHAGFIETGGTGVLFYLQWTNENALRAFRESRLPEWLRLVDAAVPGITRLDGVDTRLYRSLAAPDSPVPGCIVVVRAGFDGKDSARRWVDAVFEALESDAEADPARNPGGISGHFHITLDGTQAINFAEWTDAESHRTALETGNGKGIGRKDSPQWRRVRNFPGMRPAGAMKRYLPYRGLAVPS